MPAEMKHLTRGLSNAKLAKVRRKNLDGSEYEAAVNTALVRYVISQDSGTYIEFDDAQDPMNQAVAPMGINSPEERSIAACGD